MTMAVWGDAVAPSGADAIVADDLRVAEDRPFHPRTDAFIRQHARCSDPRGSYTTLFFSEDPIDIARAKAICARCDVRTLCLQQALEHAEPIGVWGGEFVLDGRVVATRPRRGRPPNVPYPTRVDEVTGESISA